MAESENRFVLNESTPHSSYLRLPVPFYADTRLRLLPLKLLELLCPERSLISGPKGLEWKTPWQLPNLLACFQHHHPPFLLQGLAKKKKKWWPTPSSASYRPFGTRVHVINIIKMKNGQVIGVRLVPWGIRKQLYIQLLLLDGLHHTLRDKASCWAWQPCMHAPQWKWEHAQHLLSLGHVWRPVLLPSSQAPSCLVLAWLCLGQEVAALRPNSHWEPNGNPDALASLLEWSHSCEKKRRQCSFLLHLVE